MTNREIGKHLGIDAKTAGRWRQRYQAEGPKGLRDAPRSGRPSPYTAEQKAWFFQKVLEGARDNGVPTSRWTCEDLIEFAKRAGINPTPDPATLWRWLDQADIKPHKWRYWLKITDPDFETRMKDVTGIYLKAIALAKAGIPVFCIDEKTGMQALERETPGSPTRPGKPRRHEHRYKRHGSTCFIGAFEVHSGKIQGRFVDSRDGTTFAAFIREILGREDPCPDGPFPDLEPDDRLRLTHMGGARYGLSVRRHTGRWEKTPFSGTLSELVDAICATMQHLVAAW